MNIFAFQTDVDYLVVFDGDTTNDTLLAFLNGNQSPSVISSTGNQMLVIFDSYPHNKHSAGRGIHAKIHYGNSTMVTTPYPTSTGSTGITGTTGATNGTTTGGSNPDCSTQNPCEINEGHCTADNQCMGDLMCGSDNCIPGLGFANGTNCCFDGCSMVHMTTNESGILQSPFYPDFYQSNLDCSDQIIAEEGKIITIEFESFNVSPCLSILGFKLINIILHCFLGFRWKVGGIFFICVMATVQLEMLWKL